jgi:hypothetical protein
MAVEASRGRGRRTAGTRTRVKEREAPDAVDEDIVTVDIQSLDVFSESKNIFIYGPSGHGKTVLAGGAPRATFVAAEKGVEAAKYVRYANGRKGVIRAPGWEHLAAAKRKCDEKLGPGDWAIIDSVPKCQTLMIRWILQMNKRNSPARDLDIPAIQDHQKWQNYFKRWIDSWIDAPYNCIFTATEMIRTDNEGEDIVLPAITGKDYEICNYIRAQMDVVAYYAWSDKTADGEPVRRALFQPYKQFVAPKDRYSVLGRYQDIPDGDYEAMAEFIEMIDAAAAEEKAARKSERTLG